MRLLVVDKANCHYTCPALRMTSIKVLGAGTTLSVFDGTKGRLNINDLNVVPGTSYTVYCHIESLGNGMRLI